MDPPHSTTVTDFVTDADVAGNGHGEGALGVPSTLGVSTSSSNVSVARTGANATFRNGAALRYPVWKVMIDFAKCSRHLEIPTVRRLERSNLVVQVHSLCGPNSEWLKLCRLAASAPVSGQIYMRTIPRVTSTACAGSSGTVIAPGDHTSREHGAGRGTA